MNDERPYGPPEDASDEAPGPGPDAGGEGPEPFDQPAAAAGPEPATPAAPERAAAAVSEPDAPTAAEPAAAAAPEPAAPAASVPDAPAAAEPAMTAAPEPDAPAVPEPAAEPDVDETPEPLDRDVLSPAVRRLVKQYDLDVTGIRGTGPGGRLRVADVMGALSGRGEPLDADDSPLQPVSDPGPASLQRPATDTGAEAGSEPLDERRDAARSESRPEAGAPSATTVFDCELDAALERRARARERGADVPLLAWFAAAASRALRVVPELKAGERIHVAAERAENGIRRTTTVADADTLPLQAIARALEMPEPERGGGDEAMCAFVVYDYGASGSLLAMPLPLRAGHAGALGVGAPRRELAFVRTAGGEVVLRAVDRCYLTLTYDPARVTLERANRFLAEVTQSRLE